jgi:hypothetical protein
VTINDLGLGTNRAQRKLENQFEPWFSNSHPVVHNLYYLGPHLISVELCEFLRQPAFASWKYASGVLVVHLWKMARAEQLIYQHLSGIDDLVAEQLL